MKLPRRRFLQVAGAVAAAPAVPQLASALDYPTRPVRLIVGYPAGGGADVIARLMGQWLWERTGQPFIIENRPGAGTNIATETVVRAPPDGYTLLLAGLPNASNASLFGKLNFNFIRDIVPVASVDRSPEVLVVNLSFPAKTVSEFIVYAKANPSKVNMASAGIGSVSHLAGELFKTMAGVNLVHVPYRGGASAVTDLLSGQAQMMFLPVTLSIEYIRAGKLTPLGITSAIRLEALPDIPTVSEFLPGYEASAWYGIGVPKNTPTEITGKLNTAINAAIADPKLRARLTDLGAVPMAMSPAEFGKFIADESEKWAKVIKSAGIRAE
jgi:tripartite-type tricarboxylate transporter receptor subunit TctC